jgi:hypothetical protein
MAIRRCNPLHKTKSRLAGRLRDERGQVLVEFALVLPVLLLLILGIVYFGRYMNYSNQETQLAEEGARWAAVNNNPSTTGQTLQTFIRSQAQPELQAGSSDVTSPAMVWIYYPTGSSGAFGTSVRVCVVATVKYPTPIGVPTETMAEAATMRVEQAATAWAASNNPVGTMPSQCPTA